MPLQEVVDALPQPNGDHYIERSRGTSDSTGDSADTGKRRRFEQHRKAHYHMKDALRRCAQLLVCFGDHLVEMTAFPSLLYTAHDLAHDYFMMNSHFQIKG